MRILQLIDSLRPGGAERMAVGIANQLAEVHGIAFLCCTRAEGTLKKDLSNRVDYVFLKKKNSLDLEALFKLKKFIAENGIEVVHAHSTSWFFAVLLKFFGLKIKVVWHDHYGNSDLLDFRNESLLRLFSYKIDGVISVNQNLKIWAIKNLKTKKFIQLNNFVLPVKESGYEDSAKPEQRIGFNILCVANLRPQKDHSNLLKAFEIVASEYEDVFLHLVGEDPQTSYSKKILEQIFESDFNDRIFYYGSRNPISRFIEMADIGVLSSKSEGLPLVILEYASYGLPVISTNVGECHKVIGNKGLIVQPGNPQELATTILKLYGDKEFRRKLGDTLKVQVSQNFSPQKFMSAFADFCKKL